MKTMRTWLIERLDPFFSAADRAYHEPEKAVDAILDELRNVDEGMLRAGDKGRDALAPVRTNTERTWQAMIDYARNPSREEGV